MSILTTITGIPVFTTMQEALNWAIKNKIRGYHTHKINGKLGYMGGINHKQATRRGGQNIANPNIPLSPNVPPNPNIPPNPNTGSTSGGGGGGTSGGGGGGGY